MRKFLKTLFILVFAFCFAIPSACSDNNTSGSDPNDKPGDNPPDNPSASYFDVSNVDVSHINENARLIAFTFDDGPAENTSALLSVFDEFNEKNPDYVAHATLFTLGSKITEENSAILTRAVNMNFELGNHTFTHTNLNTLSDEKVKEELSKTDLKLKVFDGKDVHLVRPAGGHADSRVLSLYKTTFVNWTASLDTKDYSDSTTENDVVNLVTANLLDGGIVLMHQGYDKTVAAVKRLLPELKASGYQVVSVSELIKYYNVKAEIGKLYDSFI